MGFNTGDVSNEKEVLNWMVAQKSDSSIQDIDRATLFEYIESKDFLAVMFCKGNAFRSFHFYYSNTFPF